MKVVDIKHLNKNYKGKRMLVNVLKDLSIEFETGKLYAIMGHSGSGKTTLFNIIGLLDSFDSGEYYLNNKEVSSYSEKEKAVMRRDEIGFVFQDFYLDGYLKAYENVIMPMIINKGITKKERKGISLELLKKVGLFDRVNHFPKELSGGEQQRVAIARALANNPTILLCDEPTGNLDVDSEKMIFNILRDLSRQDKCVIVVSHSSEIKEYADVVYKLENGQLKEDSNEF